LIFLSISMEMSVRVLIESENSFID
jgi:hypothetical protein